MKVVTIVTGDYVFGATALINSLAAAGFCDEVILAHDEAATDVPGDLQCEPAARIRFTALPRGERWAGNRKAEVLLSLEDGDYCYLDADCIVQPGFLEVIGLAVRSAPVFSAEGLIPSSDLRRWGWESDAAEAFGRRTIAKGLDACVYVNSGVIALRFPRDLSLIVDWNAMMQRALPPRGDMFETPHYLMPDQDCLNAILAFREEPFATISPPDVWYRVQPNRPFLHVGSRREPLVLHCTGQKPWNLIGPARDKPDAYDRAFLRHAFRETPWASVKRRLSPSVMRWLEDGNSQRIRRRLIGMIPRNWR
jgi:hypothetical protein